MSQPIKNFLSIDTLPGTTLSNLLSGVSSDTVSSDSVVKNFVSIDVLPNTNLYELLSKSRVPKSIQLIDVSHITFSHLGTIHTSPVTYGGFTMASNNDVFGVSSTYKFVYFDLDGITYKIPVRISTVIDYEHYNGEPVVDQTHFCHYYPSYVVGQDVRAVRYDAEHVDILITLI
uniref:Uncharacterized protein n=1 Tax=Robinvale plant virus 1 TaxID=2201325 RepID=A0A2U8JQE5_9VIRU|nr:hypothetical protein [Robinvale plant virus 1]